MKSTADPTELDPDAEGSAAVIEPTETPIDYARRLLEAVWALPLMIRAGLWVYTALGIDNDREPDVDYGIALEAVPGLPWAEQWICRGVVTAAGALLALWLFPQIWTWEWPAWLMPSAPVLRWYVIAQLVPLFADIPAGVAVELGLLEPPPGAE